MSSIHKSTSEFLALLRLHKNVVLMDQETSLEFCDYVSFDFGSGGFMAGNYLLEKGHRNIAFLSAPLENRRSRRALFRGFSRAIEQWGDGAKCTLVVEDVHVANYAQWEYENGRKLAKSLLELEDRPTAAFVYNDMTAISVMSQLMASGFRVPEDISVIGFDDIIMSEYATPPLTTIRQPSYETGTMATQTILDKIAGRCQANCRITLRPKLVERSSVLKIN